MSAMHMVRCTQDKSALEDKLLKERQLSAAEQEGCYNKSGLQATQQGWAEVLSHSGGLATLRPRQHSFNILAQNPFLSRPPTCKRQSRLQSRERQLPNVFSANKGLPLPLGRGVCETKSKNGRSRPSKPFISRVFCLRPWSWKGPDHGVGVDPETLIFAGVSGVQLLQDLRASGPFLLVFWDSHPKPGNSKSTTRQPPALMTKRSFSKSSSRYTMT